MSLAPFFGRVYGAVGAHMAISKETLTTVLEGIKPGVQLVADYDRSEYHIAELTVNMAARLYPTISIQSGDHATEKLRKLASSINPAIEFAESSTDELTICIGVPGAARCIYPSSIGWTARVSGSSSRSRHGNSYSAGAAAALACAELFRRVFLQTVATRDTVVSLLDYSDSSAEFIQSSETNLGRVMFAGVGAVGNAAVWALSRDRETKGELLLVDSEKIELSNLQRYVLAGIAEVGKSKVAVASRLLREAGFSVEVMNSTLEDVPAETAAHIPTLVVSVDNIRARRVAQALLPRLVINGWTGDRALGASWHRLDGRSACLACLYHPTKVGASATEQAAKVLGLTAERAALLWVTRQPLLEDDLNAAAGALATDVAILRPWLGKTLGELYTDVVCGAVPIHFSGLGKIETVPLVHQSVLAGVQMAAELIKRSNATLAERSQAEALVSWDDVLREPPRIWTKPRAREPGCICSDTDYLERYSAKWSSQDSPVV